MAISAIQNPTAKKVYLYLGYFCNLGCKFCGLGEGHGVSHPLKKQANFPTDQVLAAIDSLQLNERDMIEVSGGEPTLHPDVLDICRKARQSFGGRILMFSNAWRLADPKFAQDLVATGIDEIVIALHSHKSEVHDRITQVKGSHERTLAALRNLKDLSIDVSIKFITTKENVDDAPEWAMLVSREFPSARVMFNGLALWGQALDFADELAVKHSYAARHISAAVDIFADKGQPVGIYFMPACVFDPYYWQYFGFRHYQESILEARQGGGQQGSASYQACYELPKGCSECVMNTRCVWAWKPYERRYGLSELSPIVATCPEPS